MKGKIAILALAAIFSFGVASMSFAEEAKAPAAAATKTAKVSCKKQAKAMKFKDKKERTDFMATCKKGAAKK